MAFGYQPRDFGAIDRAYGCFMLALPFVLSGATLFVVLVGHERVVRWLMNLGIL